VRFVRAYACVLTEPVYSKSIVVYGESFDVIFVLKDFDGDVL
jgi:hypothetical protein